jgi:hypothetical protein
MAGQRLDLTRAMTRAGDGSAGGACEGDRLPTTNGQTALSPMSLEAI